MPEPSWFVQWSQKILSLLSKREVKTPLAFFFRCIWALLVIVVGGLWLAVPAERWNIFLVGVGFLVFLALLVSVFAWLKPKNLVYGETGHRAEYRLGLGTETGELSPEEIKSLSGTPNPRQLPRAAGEES